jgi:hypothetical protein
LDNDAAQVFFDFEMLKKLARIVLPMPEDEEDFLREQVQRALMQDGDLFAMHTNGTDFERAVAEMELREQKVFEDPYQVERHYIWASLLSEKAINVVHYFSGQSLSREQAKELVETLQQQAKEDSLPKPDTFRSFHYLKEKGLSLYAYKVN